MTHRWGRGSLISPNRDSVEEIHISVPGNLLLFGEYAITEPQGEAIACAIEPRMEASIRYGAADDAHAAAQSAGGGITVILHTAAAQHYHFPSLRYTDRSPYPLIPQVLTWLIDWFDILDHTIAMTIEIDAHQFFVSEGARKGEKIGLGSSAGITLLLTASLYWYLYRRTPEYDILAQIAIGAHRYAQNGVGSGYDILTSLHGGILHLTQCAASKEYTDITVRPLEKFDAASLYWMKGDIGVRTIDAIAQFNQWHHRHMERWRSYLLQQNRDIGLLIDSSDWNTTYAIACRLRDRAIELGDAIGIDAHIPHRAVRAFPPSSFMKAVGAGNEIIAAWEPSSVSASSPLTDEIPAGWHACPIPSKGIEWHHR